MKQLQESIELIAYEAEREMSKGANDSSLNSYIADPFAKCEISSELQEDIRSIDSSNQALNAIASLALGIVKFGKKRPMIH